MPEIHGVPQHQGSGVGADALITGGRALATLAGDLLGHPVRWVPVPSSRSPLVDGIAGRDELMEIRAAHESVRASGPVLTIGGDCGADLVPIAAARRRYGHTLSVAWFDAHGDLNTPDTSPSGAFHGMVLAAVLGLGDPSLVASPRIGGGRAALIGARALDSGEWPHVWEGRVRHLPVEAARVAGVVSSCLLETDPDEVYVHIDLDVLDPAEFGGVNYPEPDGMTVAEVAAAVRAIAAAVPVVGVGITECATDDPAKLARLVPLIETVGEVCGLRS